jgi:cephalosporin hydroxylase
VGNNSKTAVREYLELLSNQGRQGFDGEPLHFDVDGMTENKLMLTAAPGGYLRRR